MRERALRAATTTLGVLLIASAGSAAPIGQTIWLRAVSTGSFVSADQNRGAFAPLVADRPSVGGWELFDVFDAGGGFVALRAVGTGRFVSADQSRGAFAPLVADRTAVGDWESFQWTDLASGSVALRGKATGRFVSADLGRGAFAPLVDDRTAASGWETFTWAAVNAPWRLVWSDEFNGTSIDTSKWLFETGGGGWGNNELQNYTARSQNARVESGHLVIEARRESFGGNAYTSARMHTSASWLYGRMEARIRLPFGQGLWPAFWMLGADIGSVGWPACGETDIMEMIGGGGRENTVFGTIHWDNGGHVSFGRSVTGPDFSKDYHVFGVEWDTQQIRWYVDSVLYNTADITINSTEEFHAPFFVLLNVAVGGNFPGSPDATTTFPQQMLVDWVRVYQR
jgi:beta-glucanase (GH16 family)